MNRVYIRQKLETTIRNIKSRLEIKYSSIKYEDTHALFEFAEDKCKKQRITLLLPNIIRIYGGASTAISFFNKYAQLCNCEKRVISFSNIKPNAREMSELKAKIGNAEIVLYKKDTTLSVRENDIFISTAWYTAITMEPIIKAQEKYFSKKCPLLYLIQDFEPGFYRWGTEYAEADRSYKLGVDTIAIINSRELYDYFTYHNYFFYKSFWFSPVLNRELKDYLMEHSNIENEREDIILFYGRPSIHRNAFSLIVEALMVFSERLNHDNAKKWKIYSLGEKHCNIKLNQNMKIVSKGKLSIKEYARIMLTAKIGISLMISPHPSYPPLEMSTFGIKTITNTFDCKDLKEFNSNIISLDRYSAEDIAEALLQLVTENRNNHLVLNSDYVRTEDNFTEIIENILDGYKRHDS